MSSNNLISVILCNYNYGRYIEESIRSITAQTYTNIEIIIVDDGSTDNSRSIIESFNDSRIARIFQKNSGQAAAFNAGFNKCHGDYVAFIDSDDFWFPEKLEKVVSHFSRKNVSIVQHNLVVVDEYSQKKRKSHPGIKPGLKNVLIAYGKKNHTGFFSVTSGITCKRRMLEEIFPLSTDWRICADVAFTRPMPLFGHIFTCEEELGAYRIHGSNNWMRTDKQIKGWIDNQKKYCDYTNQWLHRYGHKEVIDFSKSEIFRRHNTKLSMPYILRKIKSLLNYSK